MIRATRHFLVLLILLSLAVYGAAAGKLAAGVTEMVICGAEGAETIWLDRDGNLTEAPTPCCACLDCVTLTAGTLPDPVALPQPLGRFTAAPLILTAGPVPHAHWPATRPRGPPVDTKTGYTP